MAEPPSVALEFLLPGDPLALTGGYEYDRRIVDGLRRSGWTVRVHTLDASFPFPSAQALDDANRKLASLTTNSLVVIDGLALGAMPEIAQAHSSRLQLIALVHHPLAAETGLTPQLAAHLFESERAALQPMRGVIVTSRATARELADYAVPADRIVVVEPGIDRPSNVQAASEHAASVVRMLCVATVTPRKGHDRLVDALAGLRNYSWRLTCVGDLERSPVTADALRARIVATGLEDRITLTGTLDTPALSQQFRNADLFVLATHFEGYGMAVAQALAHGLPVVSTRTGAIAELVPAQAGVIVEPNDALALRVALETVLADAGLRFRLAAGARDAGKALPDWAIASQSFAKALVAAKRIA